MCHNHHVHGEPCGFVDHVYSSELVWQKFFEAFPRPIENEKYFQNVEQALSNDLLYRQDLEDLYDGTLQKIPRCQEAADILRIFWDEFGTTIEQAIVNEGEVEFQAYLIRNMWAIQQQRKWGSMRFHQCSSPCTSNRFTLYYHNDPSMPDHSGSESSSVVEESSASSEESCPCCEITPQ